MNSVGLGGITTKLPITGRLGQLAIDALVQLEPTLSVIPKAAITKRFK